MSERASAEVYAPVLATHPCADDEARTYAHEPSVAVVVGGSCLAAEGGIVVVAHVFPKPCRGSSGLAQSAEKHLLHEERAFVADGLVAVGGRGIDFPSVAVNDACDEHGGLPSSIVGYGAIGIDHFKQADIA